MQCEKGSNSVGCLAYLVEAASVFEGVLLMVRARCHHLGIQQSLIHDVIFQKGCCDFVHFLVNLMVNVAVVVVHPEVIGGD